MRIRLAAILISLGVASNICGQTDYSWFSPDSPTVQKGLTRTHPDCQIDEKENLSELYIVDFKEQPFFVYVHPQVKSFMKNKYLMEAKAAVQKVKDNHFLLISYKINSENAKSNYGNLEKGSKIKVDLISKDHLYLENIERARGKVRRNAKQTTYTGTYAITKDNMVLLRKHSIDKITVLWEEGVEEYHLQNIDLVKNQLNCLNFY